MVSGVHTVTWLTYLAAIVANEDSIGPVLHWLWKTCITIHRYNNDSKTVHRLGWRPRSPETVNWGWVKSYSKCKSNEATRDNRRWYETPSQERDWDEECEECR